MSDEERGESGPEEERSETPHARFTKHADGQGSLEGGSRTFGAS